MQTGDHHSGRGLLYRLYQKRLKRELDQAELPHHVAMIIDGNRRWAKQLGYDSVAKAKVEIEFNRRPDKQDQEV